MFPGPYLTRVLAQYGADVIKIENTPIGDPSRNFQQSGMYELLNQGKRSVALDLKSPEAIALVKQMAGEADIFIENYRDGVMDRMGLGYAEMSETNPDLIYLSLRGLSGKESAKASHDQNFIAQSGAGEWFLESGVPNFSTQFGDIVGGMLVPAIKLLMHLSNPARTGMHLVSYMEEGFRSLYLLRAFDELESEKKSGSAKAEFGISKALDGTEPHSRYYKCRDGGWVSLNAIQEKHWNVFCDAVGHAEWKPRQKDKALTKDLEKVFSDAPATYWESLAASQEMCLFRVIPWEEHLAQTQARGQLSSDPLTWAGFAPSPGLRPAPVLGADSFAVATSLGLSHKAISEMLKNGVLFQPEP